MGHMSIQASNLQVSQKILLACRNYSRNDKCQITASSVCKVNQQGSRTRTVTFFALKLRKPVKRTYILKPIEKADMATSKVAAQMSKCISSRLMESQSIWICRAFVTSTRPSQKQYVDKETCQKVKEAAEAITEGIKETRQTGQFVKDTMTANAGKVISEMAKKALEIAAEASDDEKKGKSAWEKVKEVVKDKVNGK